MGESSVVIWIIISNLLRNIHDFWMLWQTRPLAVASLGPISVRCSFDLGGLVRGVCCGNSNGENHGQWILRCPSSDKQLERHPFRLCHRQSNWPRKLDTMKVRLDEDDANGRLDPFFWRINLHTLKIGTLRFLLIVIDCINQRESLFAEGSGECRAEPF